MNRSTFNNPSWATAESYNAYSTGGVNAPSIRVNNSSYDPQFDGEDEYAYDQGDDANIEFANEEIMWAHTVLFPTPPRRNLQNISMPDSIRKHLIDLDLETLKQMPPDDERYKELPSRYHSASYLDDEATARGTYGSFGPPSSMYKVIDQTDGQAYAVRRIDNVRNISSTIVKNAASLWSEVRHPSVVPCYNITQEKGALFFTYAYFPKAQTLKQKFIDTQGNLLNESSLWRILIQLSSGVRCIHTRNMAVRTLSPLHVILTSGGRVRINGVGIPDVLDFETRKSITDLQSDDLIKLGYLMLSLGTRTLVTIKTVDQGLHNLKQNYSLEFCQIISTLLSSKQRSIKDISVSISDHVMDEFDLAIDTCDGLQTHLREEYENGRILKILLKLGFVNERMEFANAADWSECGDRYILKLFRDYVFHQTYEHGGPVVDAGHVVSALNKLDSGDLEQILLCSRDGKDLLIVSYSDIKNCLDKAVEELVQQSGKVGGANGAAMSSSSGLSVSTVSMGMSKPSSKTSVGGGTEYYPLPPRGAAHAHSGGAHAGGAPSFGLYRGPGSSAGAGAALAADVGTGPYALRVKAPAVSTTSTSTVGAYAPPAMNVKHSSSKLSYSASAYPSPSLPSYQPPYAVDSAAAVAAMNNLKFSASPFVPNAGARPYAAASTNASTVGSNSSSRVHYGSGSGSGGASSELTPTYYGGGGGGGGGSRSAYNFNG